MKDGLYFDRTENDLGCGYCKGNQGVYLVQDKKCYPVGFIRWSKNCYHQKEIKKAQKLMGAKGITRLSIGKLMLRAYEN